MQATAWHEQQNRCAEKQQQLQQLATAAASRQMAGQQRCWAAQLKQQQPQRTSNAWCTRNASNQASVRPPLLEATSTSCGLLSRAATCTEYSRGPVGAGRRSEDRLVTWGRATLAVRHQQQQAGCLCQPACGPCSWECRSSISIEQPCAPAHTPGQCGPPVHHTELCLLLLLPTQMHLSPPAAASVLLAAGWLD